MGLSAELVVVGAGTVGGWASVFARQDGAGRVVVVDAGLAGQGASSRAAGIVRAQGGTPTAVDLARWSVAFYRTLNQRAVIDSDFRALGYLILAVSESGPTAHKRRAACPTRRARSGRRPTHAAEVRERHGGRRARPMAPSRRCC